MYSRDSSRSISSSGRDDSSTDDDGITSVAAIAKNATLLFQSRKFAECVDALNQILIKKQDDLKVLHNIAIAEYFKDCCSDPKKLLESLYKLKERSEAMAHASGKQSVGACNFRNKILVGSSVAPAAVNSRVVSTDEFDTSVATLNIATLWFHLHEYKKVCSVLEPLYQKIESLYETTAICICLMLLDVVLANQDALKCGDVMNCLEKAFVKSRHVEAGLVQQSSRISPAPTNTTTIAPCSPDDLIKTSVDDRSELKMKLQFYRARFLLLTRNIKAAKREMKIVMGIARGKDSSTALLLKSQLEYTQGNYLKATKLLIRSTDHAPTGYSTIFHTNLGCIHYRLGSPHVSAVLFARALSSSLSSLRKDNFLEILYNCGIQHLACGKPLLAADCFQKSSVIFYNRPLLWVRIAECCLMGHYEKGGKSVKACVVGKGKWRKLFVEDTERDDEDGEVPPQLSISLAHQCLLNALHLLKLRETLEKAKPAKVCNITVGSVNVSTRKEQGVVEKSLSDYEDLCRRDEDRVKQAVLANLAFLDLEMENPSKALTTANSLLEIIGCSKTYVFLGHVYAAEALFLLNRPMEGADHLARCLHEGRLVESEGGGGVGMRQEDAAGALYVNLASSWALQGNVELARGFAERALAVIPKRREAVLASVYADLMVGKSEEALAKLKCCGGVAFLVGI